jgi:hypothetical protein
MGNLTPVLGALTQTLGAIQTITSSIDALSGGDRRDLRREQDLAMRNLQQKQGQSEKQAIEDAKLERERLRLESQNTEDARRKALRRAMARQNVRFGAGGVSRTGSGEAVLLGLYNDSEDQGNNNQALDQIRYNAIDNDLANLRQNNLLQRTQLAEQQRMQRAISRY